MKILIATPYLPWPLNSGGNAAQFSTLKCLAGDHQFTVVTPVYTEEQKNHACELAAQLPQVAVRAVYVGSPPVVPLPRQLRLLRRIAKFARQKLAPVRPSPLNASAHSPPLPHYPFQPLPEAFISALADEIQLGCDLCQAEFAEMLPLGTWFPKDHPRVFVHHQIHAVYAARFANTFGRTSYGDYLARVMLAQERAYLQHYDGVVALSEIDRLALHEFIPAEQTFASQFPIPTDVGFAPHPAPEWTGRFVFIGSENHVPNQDALDWLLRSIWPQIASRLTGARLVIIGTWSASTRQRCTIPAVEFSGFVDNLVDKIRGSVMLVPLRIGSGIRTKIVVALAQGVPVVTTTVGGEGLPLRNELDAFICDSVDEFAEAAVRLARESKLWRAVSEAGLRCAMANFSPEQVRRRRNEIYSIVATKHRARNTP